MRSFEERERIAECTRVTGCLDVTTRAVAQSRLGWDRLGEDVDRSVDRVRIDEEECWFPHVTEDGVPWFAQGYAVFGEKSVVWECASCWYSITLPIAGSALPLHELEVPAVGGINQVWCRKQHPVRVMDSARAKREGQDSVLIPDSSGIRRTVFRRGDWHLTWVCSECGQAFSGLSQTVLVHRGVLLEELDEYVHPSAHTWTEPEWSDPKPLCVYVGCGRMSDDYHHFGPKAVFGEDADRWPVMPLCKPHHQEWHARMNWMSSHGVATEKRVSDLLHGTYVASDGRIVYARVETGTKVDERTGRLVVCDQEPDADGTVSALMHWDDMPDGVMGRVRLDALTMIEKNRFWNDVWKLSGIKNIHESLRVAARRVSDGEAQTWNDAADTWKAAPCCDGYYLEFALRMGLRTEGLHSPRCPYSGGKDALLADVVPGPIIGL